MHQSRIELRLELPLAAHSVHQRRPSKLVCTGDHSGIVHERYWCEFRDHSRRCEPCWLCVLVRATAGTNWLRMRKVENRGTTRGAVQLVTPNGLSGHPPLKRSNSAADDDTFLTFSFPVPAVDPATNKSGHLYVAYADGSTNANDKVDIFFTRSTD